MFSSYWTDIVFTLELLLGTEKLKWSRMKTGAGKRHILILH